MSVKMLRPINFVGYNFTLFCLELVSLLQMIEKFFSVHLWMINAPQTGDYFFFFHTLSFFACQAHQADQSDALGSGPRSNTGRTPLSVSRVNSPIRLV